MEFKGQKILPREKLHGCQRPVLVTKVDLVSRGWMSSWQQRRLNVTREEGSFRSEKKTSPVGSKEPFCFWDHVSRQECLSVCADVLWCQTVSKPSTQHWKSLKQQEVPGLHSLLKSLPSRLEVGGYKNSRFARSLCFSMNISEPHTSFLHSLPSCLHSSTLGFTP